MKYLELFILNNVESKINGYFIKAKPQQNIVFIKSFS
jgi:hypothetical protein